MAKVRNNLAMRGLSGSLGEQVVIKIDKAGRTIVCNKPKFYKNREWTPAQQAQHLAFREARAYAKNAKAQEVYVRRAEGTPLNPFNVAMADWFHAPEIREIDLAAWTGGIGQPIRIRAMDDVQVTQVTVVISDEEGTVLEEGTAVEDDGLWWTYVTSSTIGESRAKVTVSARDLPGNVAQVTKPP